jgi:CRISPR-associated protein Csd2
MGIENRYDFLIVFDVKDGNPNGDPDAGNMPRVDAETGQGLVTDVCLKRKIRNYVALKNAYQTPYDIYIKEKAVLEALHEAAYIEIGAKDELDGKDVKTKGRIGEKDTVSDARKHMCKNYYDVRTFGAVMSTGINCGQVRGPVQLTFARSVEPIMQMEHSITRMAVATKKEAEAQKGDNRTMGRKHTIPYGLYVAKGFISAHLSDDTGFDEKDLELFWEAVGSMFEHDHSAARGDMNVRGLYVFRHESRLGNAPAFSLFDRVKIVAKPEVLAPRGFADYEVSIDEASMPQGVTLHRKIG